MRQLARYHNFRMARPVVRHAAISAVLYVLATAMLGHELLANLATRIVHDEVDPLLIAGILQWNATNLPFTDAWWQFPIFHPARDVLAFSEHLLGVSVIFTPLTWLTGNSIVAANLTSLATFPLSAMAAFALARYLTGNSVAAFVAGLVYAFGPYRMGQLAHVQMLAVQWAPLALLGLHLYLDTRRPRWLVLFGASWLLQAWSNGYALFFLTVFVGLWMLWFVVSRRRWHTAVSVALAMAVASIPLAPILSKYVAVHAFNGFTRSVVEIRAYSADALGVLCAPFEVSAWGWLQRACVPEGQLFPGLFTGVLFAAGFLLLRADPAREPRPRRWLSVVRLLLVAFAVVQLTSALAVAVGGPWNVEWGPIAAHATSPARPFMLGLVALFIVFVASPGFRAAARDASPLGFYLIATVLMWWCALGPDPKVGAEASELPGPFALLMQLPGFNSLRVPARFWLMGTLSMAMVVAFAVSALGRARPVLASSAAAVALSIAVLSDGWELHFPTAAVPPGPPNPALLRGQSVLFLPAGNIADVFPTYYGVEYGWRSVNGYSGFEPNHYDGVRQASKFELDGLFTAFTENTDLHVVVAADAPRMRQVVERVPGARITGTSATATQYIVPSRSRTVAVPRGTPAPVAQVTSSCPPASLLADRSRDEVWTCAPQDGTETITLTLESPTRVTGLRLTQGRPVEFPRQLLIETSIDGASWTRARRGDIVPEFIRAALASPTLPVVDVAIEPVEARVVRLRQVGHDPMAAWSLREVEVLAEALSSSR
jgi:hypothetical protein